MTIAEPRRVPGIVFEETKIESDTAGVELHIRNKRPSDATRFSPDRTIVMVHGATFSSGSLFDVPFGGKSFIDYLALSGYDVHAVDVRGYGRSTRPPEMEAPEGDSPPLVDTETGIADFAAAVEHVLKLRGLSRVCVFGMSWGGTVAGAFTSRNPDKVHKLALLAPQWVSERPIPLDFGGPLGAYRLVPVREGKARWLGTAPEHGRADLIPNGWFEQWADYTLAEDPWSADRTPDKLRATNGPIKDIRLFWGVGKPFYDPSVISAPILLVHGEWDFDVPIDLAQALFLEFRSARYRRWVEIGEATHLVLMEKNRQMAIHAIVSFLDEEYGAES